MTEKQSRVNRARAKIKRWKHFCWLIEDLKRMGLCQSEICIKVCIREDDLRILPQSRLTMILQGNSYPSERIISAVEGLYHELKNKQ